MSKTLSKSLDATRV
jgi:hypothetical protein